MKGVYVTVGLMNQRIIIFPMLGISWAYDHVAIDISFIVFAGSIVFIR